MLALATILQRLAGERLIDYLRPDVLDPLGIGDLRWARTAAGGDMGFSGVYTDLDAVARLGQLYLDDGVWDGRRLLPAGWVGDASAVQIANPQREEPDWQQGYGFQLWMSRHGYRGDGAFGQYMVVLPEHDAVVAMFSCTEQMQVVLDLMWEHLLPAMHADELPPSPADDVLARRLATLALPTVAERRGGGAPDRAGDDVPPCALALRRIDGVGGRDERPVDDRPRGRRVDRGPADRGVVASAIRRWPRARAGSPTDGSRSTWRSSPPRTGWRSSSTRRPARSSPAGRSSRCSAPAWVRSSTRCGRRIDNDVGVPVCAPYDGEPQCGSATSTAVSSASGADPASLAQW